MAEKQNKCPGDCVLEQRVHAIEEKLLLSTEWMDKQEMLMAENTETTKEVLEIVTMAKGFFKVLGHIGSALKWATGLAASVGLLMSLWSHGAPPK